MIVKVLQNLTSPNVSMIVQMMEVDITQLTYDAMRDMNKQVADKIAAEIYRKNKKKIIAGIDIDLVTAEVEKILLQKIKAQALTPSNPQK